MRRPWKPPTPEALLTKSIRQLLNSVGIFAWKEWGGPRGDGITVNPEWGADTSSGGFDSHALPPSYKKGSPQWRPLLTHIDT